MSLPPRAIYAKLLEDRRAEILRREQRHRRMGYAQLATVACAAILVWLSLSGGGFSILWVLVPAAAFIALIVFHDQLLKAVERRRRAARYFENGIARLDGNWPGT